MSLPVDVCSKCTFDVPLYFSGLSLHFGRPTTLKQFMTVIQAITTHYLQQSSSCLRIIAGTPHFISLLDAEKQRPQRRNPEGKANTPASTAKVIVASNNSVVHIQDPGVENAGKSMYRCRVPQKLPDGRSFIDLAPSLC
jgi:hypothetical protein